MNSDRSSRHLSFLQSILNAEVDSPESLHVALARAATHLLPSKVCRFWRFDSDEEVFTVQGSAPPLEDSVSSIPAHGSLLGDAITEQAIKHVQEPLNDTRHHNKDFVQRHGLKDLWIIPMFLEHKSERCPYGVLAIYAASSRGDCQLGDKEVDLLCGLTNLIERHCRALDSARATAMLELGRLRGESSLNFWGRLATSIADLLSFDGCALFVVDRTDLRIRRVGASGVETAREYPNALVRDNCVEYQKGQSATGHIFEAGRTVHSNNYFDEEWYEGPPRHAFSADIGTTLLGTPIFETPNGRVIGIIRANDKRRNLEPEGEQRINQDDIARIEAVAKELSPIVQHYLNAEDNRVLWALASHDLRAPINVLRDAAGTVLNQSQARLSKDDKRNLNNIIHNSGLLQLLVDMLATTAEEKIKYTFEWFALFNKSISKILSLLEPTAENAGVSLTHGGFGSFPRMWLDRKRIEIVLYNMLMNAIKYSDQDTSIRIAWDAEGDAYVVRIRNYGPGVPEDEKEDIFRPFFRASNAEAMAGEGRGLGLFIVRRIMTSHGGDVQLTEPRDPTIFTLMFPRELCNERPTQ